MLNNTLSNNEVRDAGAAAVSFERISSGDRQTVFSKVGESPAFPYRLSIKHEETGSGLKRSRRSVVRIDKTVASTVDASATVTASAYVVLVNPVGGLIANTEVANVLANVTTLLSNTGGANTAIVYGGTANGSATLLNGTL